METQRKEIRLADFETLPEAILMRRVERLAYYSKNFNVRTEMEWVDQVGKPGQRVFNFVVTKPVAGSVSEEVLEVVRGHHDDLEGEFEAVKTRWVLNYDNRWNRAAFLTI